MSEKTYTPGRVTWRELMTTDVERARVFYSEAFHWRIEAGMDMGEAGTYFMCTAGDKQVAGLMKSPAPMSYWGSVVSVTDPDAAVAKATELGAKVMLPPTSMPGVGRYATISDADGAVISMLKSDDGDPAPGMPKLSELYWESLSTSDVARASAFYTQVFGWQSGVGSNGVAMFSTHGTPETGVADVQKAQGFPPHWMTYVVVAKIESACSRVEGLGAKVLVPLIEVPTVGRIAVIADPTGAVIGLFEPGAR